MPNWLSALKYNHQKGEIGGLVSVCSAHPLVLQAAMQISLAYDRPFLVEATGAQVNQFGGYSGMTPVRFAGFVKNLASSLGLSPEQVIIGADHLGPQIWKKNPRKTAMQKAEELVRQCVAAGFEKIHLDTAAPCLDDGVSALPVEVVARRAARLCKAAEDMNAGMGRSGGLFYVIGNEVPVPGGGLEKGMTVPVTDPDKMRFSIEQYKMAFQRFSLDSAWSRVVGLVVQPGVDFGDHAVTGYDAGKASSLSACHADLPGIMTYEIHATDYQTPTALKEMVRDHFVLLKTGPCLTFALRKVLYTLAGFESDLPEVPLPSNLIQVMENLMMANPVHWQAHYRGSPKEVKHLRHFSLRDRIRYYWPLPEAVFAVNRLIQNLHRPLPESWVKHHLPNLHSDIEEQGILADPDAILKLAVRKELAPYWKACLAPSL
ncbi:MAG: class II D-tagatose-bisphosphate aldolase, non-catalytic subunit [Proteobacteria bacterium]|nr:class II D-tagatose-bisphosphate aldolase, non-catalytic subunit [Pseudomonadota bacterium]